MLKIKEFTCVNDCFQHDNNEVIGLYGQTQRSCIIFLSEKGLTGFDSEVSGYVSMSSVVRLAR